MTAYQISRQEAWVISTLLNMPIQQGSVLGEWLGNQDLPSSKQVEAWIPSAIKTLDHKGYTLTPKEKKSISVDLIESLMLAAVGQKHIFTTLRMNTGGVSTRFLLAGSGIVQYGYEKDTLVLHSPQQFEEALQILLPNWLPIEPGESAPISMPQGAFLLFKQACYQRDIAFVLNANGSDAFLKTDLDEFFARDNAWIDVFHALGINGVTPLEGISVSDQLYFLLSIGYLEIKNQTCLQIGSAGAALAESLSDPDQVSITIGFNGLQPERSCTSVFLIGSHRLYRLDFLGASISITPLQSRLEGLDWIRSLAAAR